MNISVICIKNINKEYLRKKSKILFYQYSKTDYTIKISSPYISFHKNIFCKNSLVSKCLNLKIYFYPGFTPFFFEETETRVLFHKGT